MRNFPVVMSAALSLSLLAGCAMLGPRVDVKPIAFQHPEEMVKGTNQLSGYGALADRRIFALMAFLNAVGYDEEAPNARMSPLRLKVREMVARNLADHPEKLHAWQRYYQAHRRGDWQYANFVLSLSPDPPFRRIRPTRELTYKITASELSDLPAILNDFWATAKLEDIWANLRPDYAAQIGRYSPARMAEEMAFLWNYLRMPRKDNWTVIHIPNPLQKHYTASANRFESYFISIDGPGSSGGGLNVHEYLHTFVNDLVRQCYAAQQPKLKQYFLAGKDAPLSAYNPNPRDWASECLVHALTHRIAVREAANPEVVKRIERNVSSLTKAGYRLLGPLYAGLADFEKSSLPFDRYLPILLAQLPEYRPESPLAAKP